MPFKSTLLRVARPFALVHFAVRTLHISLGCWSVLGARPSDDSAAFRAASVLCLRVGTVFRIPYICQKSRGIRLPPPSVAFVFLLAVAVRANATP